MILRARSKTAAQKGICGTKVAVVIVLACLIVASSAADQGNIAAKEAKDTLVESSIVTTNYNTRTINDFAFIQVQRIFCEASRDHRLSSEVCQKYAQYVAEYENYAVGAYAIKSAMIKSAADVKSDRRWKELLLQLAKDGPAFVQCAEGCDFDAKDKKTYETISAMMRAYTDRESGGDNGFRTLMMKCNFLKMAIPLIPRLQEKLPVEKYAKLPESFTKNGNEFLRLEERREKSATDGARQIQTLNRYNDNEAVVLKKIIVLGKGCGLEMNDIQVQTNAYKTIKMPVLKLDKYRQGK